MKHLTQRWLIFVGAVLLGWSRPGAAQEDSALELVWQGLSLGGALYTVNFIHEGGHWAMGELLNYDVDMKVHPFSGHAEVEKRRGRVKDHDLGPIAIAGSVATRGVYEMANGWLMNRPHDRLTPWLSWTAVGLRLDLPYQQGKAIVNHWRGDHRDDDDDIATFYDSLPGGTNEVRLYHALGAALTIWDLMTDSDELMYHISGGLGEAPLRPREPRHWNMGLDSRGAFLSWFTHF